MSCHYIFRQARALAPLIGERKEGISGFVSVLPPCGLPGVWHQGLAEIRCPNPVRFGRNLGIEAIASASPTFLERTQVEVSSDQSRFDKMLA